MLIPFSSNKVVCAVLAHPDDECFSMGGSLADWASAGAKVVVICATRGEAGEISHPQLATPDTLARVREQEMQASCDMLGVRELRFLDYADSGARCERVNGSASCLAVADPLVIADELCTQFLGLQPDLIVTHEPINEDHPDHLSISVYTTIAFEMMRNRVGRQVELYYTRPPQRFFRGMAEWLEVQTPEADRSVLQQLKARGMPDVIVTHRLKVTPYLDQKLKSRACHRTQNHPDKPFYRIPPALLAQLLDEEHFRFVTRTSP